MSRTCAHCKQPADMALLVGAREDAVLPLCAACYNDPTIDLTPLIKQGAPA